MANIQKLTYPYFTDGSTQLNAQNLNPIISKMNEMIEAINSGVTPTPTQTVATPTISISGTTATISCSTSGATIRYAINGTPTESSGTVIANGGTVNLSSYSASTVIRAIAYKSGMTTSQVAQATYTPAASYDSDAQAIMNRYTKSLSTAKKNAFNTFIVNLKNGGIYSKIKCLIIPVLANNITEATQNALTGNSAFSEGGATLALDNNGGIKPVLDATVAKISSSTFPDASSQNLHMSFYNITGSDDTAYWDVALSMTSYNLYTFGLGFSAAGELGSSYKDSDNDPTSHSSNVITKPTAKVHAILSCGSSNILLTFNSQGEPSTVIKERMLASGLTAGDIAFGQYNGGATYNMTEQDSKSKMMTRATYGLFTIGTALTQTEAENFNTYVCSFMDSFLG